MTEVIIEEVRDKPRVVLAGDSNATYDNKLFDELDSHLKSAFSRGLKTTFNMRQKTDPGYAAAAVDMIYVSPGIKVLRSACPDVDVSDHLPMIASVEID